MFSKTIYTYKNAGAKTMREWAHHFNIDINVLRYRWNAGVRGDDLFKPVQSRVSYNQYVTYSASEDEPEETKTIKEWAEEFNVNPSTLAQRYAKGERGDVLFRRIRHRTK